MKKIRVMLVMILIMMTIAVGQTFAGEQNTGDYPATVTVVVVGDSSEKAPEAIQVNPGDCFKVVLYAAAGTGYEWTLDSGRLTSIEMLESNVVSVSNPLLTGGPAKWEFSLRVKPETAGQETLHFYLSRSWEKNENPARFFDLTVITE